MRVFGWLNRLSIQRKLFLPPLVVSLVLIIGLISTSQFIVTRLMTSQQSEYQALSLDHAEKYVVSLFRAAETGIRQIYRSPVLVEHLSRDFDGSDLPGISATVAAFDNMMRGAFVQDVYIQEVVILGTNGFAYSFEFGLDGEFLGPGFHLDRLRSESEIAAALGLDEAALVFDWDGISDPDSPAGQVAEMLAGNLISARTISDAGGRELGVMIIVFSKENVPSFFEHLSENQILYLQDRNGRTIWSSSDTDRFEAQASVITGAFRSREVIEAGGHRYLRQGVRIGLNDFQIVSLIDLEKVLQSLLLVRRYTIVYGVGFGLIVLIVSLILSRRVSRPIRDLAIEFLSNPDVILGSRPSRPHRTAVDLRTRLLRYFLLAFIVPNVAFIAVLFNSYYSIYRNRITESAVVTTGLLKSNVDYLLDIYDDTSRQISYSDGVQSLLRGAQRNENLETDRDRVSQLFSDAQIAVKDLIGMTLYDTDGRNVYSSIYYDSGSASELTPRFFDLMDGTTGELVYLPGAKDVHAIPTMVLGRVVRSKADPGFGAVRGYGVWYLDQSAFASLHRDLRTIDEAHLAIVDSTGGAVGEKNSIALATALEPLLNRARDPVTPAHSGTIRLAGSEYITAFGTTSLARLTIGTIIPYRSIAERFVPLLISAAFWVTVYVAALLLTAYSITHNILGRIHDLREQMDDEFAERSPVPGDAQPLGDEIDVLFGRFQSMVERINQLIKENYQTKLHENELRFLEQEAQLNALRQQVNPHFLYNTLEAIKWMAYERNATEICDMASALGTFFRGSISGGGEYVTFRAEIAHLNSYFEIQRLRLGNRFDLAIGIEDELVECGTIKLLLQPLVENAFEHGLAGVRRKGLVEVKVWSEGSTAQIEIADNGAGMSPERVRAVLDRLRSPTDDGHTDSIGIRNVHMRLKLHFGDRFALEIRSNVGAGTSIRIGFPLIDANGVILESTDSAFGKASESSGGALDVQ